MSEAKKLLIERAARECVRCLEISRWAARMGDFAVANQYKRRAGVLSQVAFVQAAQS